MTNEEIDACVEDIRSGRPLGIKRAIALCAQAREANALKEALFGSFLRLANGEYDCVHCDRSIDPYKWTTAEHDAECIINRCRPALASGSGT